MEKIIDFWRWVYNNHYQSKEIKEEDKPILSNLCLLTLALQKIDSENVEWLKLSARYVENQFNSNSFIGDLDRLKDKDAKGYVGKIFLEMLKEYIPFPHTEQEYVKSIVKYLYKRGTEKSKKDANTICNIYGENGHEFLRELWEKHNSKKGN